jgi:hypothetical protein
VSGRLPPKAERRALLRERGWTRIGSYGSETWTHPRCSRSRFFTLAAAYRTEIGLYDPAPIGPVLELHRNGREAEREMEVERALGIEWEIGEDE